MSAQPRRYIIQLGIFGEVPEDQVEAAVRAVFE
jgi:hypothetical protein